MPLETDAVARRCIVNVDGCTLTNKCEECKKEIIKLIEIDDMFADYFAQLNYLRQRAEKNK